MNNRFILQPSEKPNHWVCTDTVNLITCTFMEHKFNETQQFVMLEDFNPENYMLLAHIMREFGDWLSENYYHLLF